MTAPNFGNIQTPQFIPAPQRQNQLAEFGQLFATIVQNREQLAQQRERMAMERERLDADLEMDKLQKKEKLAKLEQDEKIIGARNIVVNEALPTLASMPGGITPEAVEQERMRLIKQYGKDFGTHISTALNEGVAGLENVRAGIAQRQSAVANAKVDEATVQADISKAVTDAERAGVELRTARVDEALANMERAYPAARLAQFRGYLENGVSASDAARLSMVRLPPGVPPDFKLPLAAGASGAGGADAKKAEALGSQARMGLDLIESAGSLPLSLPADLFRSTQGKSGVVGVLTKHLVNPRISPEEQMALQGYLLIGQAYTIHVTGATATDQQNQLFANTIIPLASDDPATQQQKRVVLKLLPELIARNLKPAEIAARMAAEGKRVGMNPARVKLLEAQIPLAQRYQNSPEYKQGVAREPAAPRDATAGFDPAVAGRYRTPTP